ncbi:MAG: alpha/beta hydrolase [Pseudorhodoplanes sp.]|jgi:fermentation-respiration switch protein FrsA (DUF1100 family)|nr:alpha/beta hydrolase [Pseudorhodoplanes sp.]
MAILKPILLTVLVCYGGIVGLMYLAQRSLMYFPEVVRTAPAMTGFSQARENVLKSSDGTDVIVWHVAPREEKPVFLYFHGNGGALRHRVARFKNLTADGSGLVALSYRGYGGSGGSPSEEGLLADGDAAYAFARAQYPKAKLVIWGESLGTGVAVAVAAERKADALILEAPYTSTADIAFAAYPFIPVSLLMKDQFRSDTRIGQVKAPILIFHGMRDNVIPFAYGQRLFELAPEPKRFVPFPLGEHENLDQHGAQVAVREFLEKTVN